MLTIKNVKETLKKEWILQNVIKNSVYASLFVNKYEEDPANFNETMKIPVMTDTIEQKDFSYETGYEEKYVNEGFVTMKLDQHYTVYNRIGKLDRINEDWSSKKMQVMISKQAIKMDKYLVQVLATPTPNKSIVIENAAEVTKDNIIDIFFDLQSQMEEIGEDIDSCVIYISNKVAAAAVRAKIIDEKLSIENTKTKISKILGFKCVTMPIEKYNQQIIVAPQRAIGWCLAVIDPATAGVYTQGSFLNQWFISKNDAYGAAHLLPEKIVFYPMPTHAKTKSSANNNTRSFESIDESFISLKNKVYDELIALANNKEENMNLLKKNNDWFLKLKTERELTDFKIRMQNKFK
jgi:hypothetical protein